MGLFGSIIKTAGSKIVEIAKDGVNVKQVLEKAKDKAKETRSPEQANHYCNYINNNINKIHNSLSDLQRETKFLINELTSEHRSKLSFKEKLDLKKALKSFKGKVNLNLRYLYLSRDFFVALTKSASNINLKDEEKLLIISFCPYFDGTPVLDIDNKKDDSFVNSVKDSGRGVLSFFGLSNHLDFNDYLSRYDKKIEEYSMPDVDGALAGFTAAFSAQSTDNCPNDEKKPDCTGSDESIKTIECPSCHTKLNANSKFCPECGNKIEIKKPLFCTQCGEPISDDAKFCGNCGTKI